MLRFFLNDVKWLNQTNEHIHHPKCLIVFVLRLFAISCLGDIGIHRTQLSALCTTLCHQFTKEATLPPLSKNSHALTTNSPSMELMATPILFPTLCVQGFRMSHRGNTMVVFLSFSTRVVKLGSFKITMPRLTQCQLSPNQNEEEAEAVRTLWKSCFEVQEAATSETTL